MHAKPGMFFEVIFGSELVSLGPVQKKMKIIDAVTVTVTCDTMGLYLHVR